MRGTVSGSPGETCECSRHSILFTRSRRFRFDRRVVTRSRETCSDGVTEFYQRSRAYDKRNSPPCCVNTGESVRFRVQTVPRRHVPVAVACRRHQSRFPIDRHRVPGEMSEYHVQIIPRVVSSAS